MSAFYNTVRIGLFVLFVLVVIALFVGFDLTPAVAALGNNARNCVEIVYRSGASELICQ